MDISSSIARLSINEQLLAIQPGYSLAMSITEFVDRYCEGRQSIRRLCETATEEDPTLLFTWLNVHAFVHAIPLVASSNTTKDLKPPFPLPDNSTVEQFKDALLSYVCAQVLESSTARPFERTALLCDLGAYGQSIGVIVRLEYDPWFMAVVESLNSDDALPIALLAVVARPTRRKRIVHIMNMGGSSLWGLNGLGH